MKYTMNAGLEVHVELATESKIFCGCSTAFTHRGETGRENTQVCPVCSGMPGALPVLNKTVVEYAIRTGLALHCRIAEYTQFDRKNYFYPDLPKAYQISQLHFPICRDGYLDIDVGGSVKRIGIHEIHMEEDAGKLTHDALDGFTLVDFNRCGVPLLEIVTVPDFHSAEEVVAYVEKLREILAYTGVSDCRMQEGSMRVDLNISVRPEGSHRIGTRTEMKNMGSIRAIGRAVNAEAARQADVLEAGGSISQETRRWDESSNTSHSMRSKEDAHDYRYFPEPDLMPVRIGSEWVERVQAEMPELAGQKRARYMGEYGLPEYDAKVLTSEREWAELFERTADLSGHPKEAGNMIMGEVMRLCGEAGILPEGLRIDPRKIADIILLVMDGRINRNVGKDVLERVFYDDVEPVAYVEEHGLAMLDDVAVIRAAVEKVLAENTKSVGDYRGGKAKALGFLMGKAMHALGGRADPRLVKEMLEEML